MHAPLLDSQDIVALRSEVNIVRGFIEKGSYLERGSLRGTGLARHPFIAVDDEVWCGGNGGVSTRLNPDFRSRE